ncbi:lipopolysaccharide biosynthesis protein [Flavobacteriaceae bacterium]|nr:lipopolysaccharide biosynthesis protein [Flavobacteriaceae bacterium]
MAFKKYASKGIFWAFTEQLGVKGLGLVVQILIARLLVPDDFGLIAMIAVFIGVGDLLVDSGLGQSLIRTREPQQADFSTVFYLNITSAFVIYLMFYVTAPHLADFYNRTELINILRVFSFAIIFGSFSVVQKAILTINMNFRKQMLIQIPSLLISSLIGLALAYKGQGVWAIVFMKVLYPFFASILYWVYSDWRPILIFDVDKLKYHYLFGYKLMITYMLNAFFNDIYSVLIGKYYSANILGFYNRAITFQRFPTILTGKSINRVSYPLFTKVGEDIDKFKTIILKINKLIAYFYVPLLFFLIFNVHEIIVFLLTEKWTNIIPFFQILCLGAFLEPMTHYYGSVINSFGDSGLVLKISFYSRILTVIGLIFITKIGVYPLVIFQAVNIFFTALVFMYYGGRKINYKLLKQFKEILPELSIGISSSVLIYFLCCWINFNGIYSVIIYLLSFVIFYIIISEILKLTTYVFVKNELLAVFNK